MLVSGLWKLAAMAGVIGVGLVAVYQAQKGMDKPAVTATEGGPEAATEPLAGTESVSEPAADPQQEPNPFGDPSQGLTELTGATTDKQSGGQPSLAAPTEDDGFGEIESTSRRKAAAQKLPSDGVDFRGDPAESTGTAAVPADTNHEVAAGSTQPARLPDDLDALEAQVKAAAEKSKLVPKGLAAKPYVRQARADAEQPADPQTVKADGLTEDKADPFGNSNVTESPATETPAESDPFESNPTTPAEPLPKGSTGEIPDPKTDLGSEPNPFEDFPLKTNPAPAPAAVPAPATVPATEPFLESPTTVQPLPNSDPFGQQPAPPTPPRKSVPVTEPTLGTPADIKPVPTKIPTEIPENTVPIRTRPQPVAEPEFPTTIPKRSDPKLPTEIPDGFDSGFPAEPPTRNDFPKNPGRNPVPESPRRSLPDRSLPDGNPIPSRRPDIRPSQPQPSEGDLAGDGTVNSTHPRGVQQARLTIEKIAPQQATLGEPLVYSVIVKNIGTADAHQVVVEDRVPKGTDMVGSSPPGYLVEKKMPDSDVIEKKLSWPIGTLKPNEQKKISIKVIPRQEGPIGSVARVNFATEVAAEIQVAGPKLTFTVKAPPQARVGESIEMVFLLKNTGAGPASNVSVRDLIPAGLKHEASSDIECPIGKLAPNETREIVLTVTAIKPGRATNRAILTGDGGINQQLETQIDVIGEQLALTRTGQTKVYVDRATQFTNSIRNEGDTEVKHVRIAEVVPAGMEFVAATNGGQYDQVQRAIFWDLGALPPGAEAKVSSKLIAKESGVQQGKVTATGPTGSTASIKTDIDAVGRPELQIEAISRADAITVGDRLTSKIQLKNHGSAAARNVRLSIRLPRELKLINARGVRSTLQDGIITFEPIASIDPNGTVAFEVEMEAIAVAQTQMNLEISADHLTKPARRNETVEIAAEVRP